MKTKTHLHIRMLCEGALMVAMAQVLSYVKLAEAPNGGSITPAMFPIIFFAVRWGLGSGLLAGFLFGLLQLMFDGAYAWGWQSMLLDYLIAFTPLGLAGLFKNKPWGLFAGPAIRHTVDGGGPPYIHKGKKKPAFTGHHIFMVFSAEKDEEIKENAA